MKRPHDIEDAGDRAQRQRRPGLVRIPLDKIGFWPGNRGGLGISAHHVHEVAWDCLANKTKLQRYTCVDLIEIPEECLKAIRDENRERCEADSLMPRLSAKIQFVCASKPILCMHTNWPTMEPAPYSMRATCPFVGRTQTLRVS